MFQDNLLDRKQPVIFQGQPSTSKIVNAGVPPSFSVGTTVIPIMRERFDNSADLIWILLYADDTVIYYPSEKLQNIEATIYIELVNIST